MGWGKSRALLGAASLYAVLAIAGIARADDAPTTPQADYTLFNPVPNDKLPALCTDRPTKSNGPCTVPAGHWQVESDVLDAAFQRQGGVTTDTILYASSNLKLGLTNDLDAELNISPAETIVTHDRNTRIDGDLTGFGNLVARVKWEVVGANGGAVSLSLSPYVSLPTARRGIGDGAVEEGLLVPVQVNLPADFSLGFNGEVDALKNQDDAGRHANYIAILTLNHPLTKTVTGSVELWSDVNADPSGVVRQYSFDLSMAWVPPALPNVQLDGGLNLGLNAATPGAQVYLGLSRRF